MKGDFTRLKRKILLQVVLWITGAILLAVFIQSFLIDGLLQAPFANSFVWVGQNIFGLNFYQARDVYDIMFRNQKALLLAVGLILLLVAIFYYTLSRLTRYFNEIEDAVGVLADFDEDPSTTTSTIHLSPEMASVEAKLKEVQEELIVREREREQAESRKSDLVAYLAHDIRTPLTSVIGYLTLLNDEPEMDVTTRTSYTKTTLKNALRLEELTDELFELTRFNARSTPIQGPVDLSMLLEQMADEFTVLAQTQKHCEIKAGIEKNLVVLGNADELARVFQNLLKNAISFCAAHTEITLSTNQSDTSVFISVTNIGPVIPEESLEVIFEKFYRLDEARRSSTGGSGLGLAISREIVVAHGGMIGVSSDPQTRKTTFTVTLPKARTAQMGS